jgi:beta-glucanase (GH16 family)
MRSHFPSLTTVAAFVVVTIGPFGCNNGKSLPANQSGAAASGGAHAMTGGAAGTSRSSSGGGSDSGTGQGGASGAAANADGGTKGTNGSTTPGAAGGGATNGGAPSSGGSSAAGSDLIVTEIGLSPKSPTSGQAVTFSATVKNQGTAPTRTGTIVGVLFSIDGTPVSWSDTHTQALAAGATITLTANGGPSDLATWTATSGSHQVRAFVDDIDRIDESNEGNNQLTLSITVDGDCASDCSGKVCGSDGCGGSCGSCDSGMSCDASGQCVAGSALPSWNASPPAGMSPAPSGSVVGDDGEFDTGPLASNEIWDNFDGASGSKPDSRLWVVDTTNQGGTQVYDPARTFLDGAGNVVLEAIQSGNTVYSGRFTSRTKFNMRYGWCAARIKFPKAGQSWFPAFWLLHQGYNTNSNYGEIDVMEFFGDTKKYSTHLYITDNTLESTKPVPDDHSGGDAGDGYHTYWMQWEPDRIRIGVDDLVMGDWGPTSVPAGQWDLSVSQPFYFIANFAVHPDWLPAPLASDFPARMLIDWIWYKPL